MITQQSTKQWQVGKQFVFNHAFKKTDKAIDYTEFFF